MNAQPSPRKDGAPGRTPGRRARIAAAILALAGPGALVALHATGSHAPASPRTALLTASRSSERAATSKQTTLPQCGATRDPFDPTDSAPPAGSPSC